MEYLVSFEEDHIPRASMMDYGQSQPSQYPHQQSSPVLVLGNGDLKKSLTEMVGLQREARQRFQDVGAEGLLKTILYKEVVKELGISPEPSRAYLQERISTEVSRGFVQDYPSKGKHELPILEFMRKNIPAEQFDLYSMTGFYADAKSGVVYHGTGNPIADLKQYIGQEKGNRYGLPNRPRAD